MPIYQYAMGFDIFTSLPNFQSIEFEIIEDENGDKELGDSSLMAEGTVSSPLAIIYNHAFKMSFERTSIDIDNSFRISFKGVNDFNSRINHKFIYAEKIHELKPYLNKIFSAQRIPYSIEELKSKQLKVESRLFATNIDHKIAAYESSRNSAKLHPEFLSKQEFKRNGIRSNLYTFNYLSYKHSYKLDRVNLHRKDEKRFLSIKNEDITMLPSVVKEGLIKDFYNLYATPVKEFNLFSENNILSVQPIRQGNLSEDFYESERDDLIGVKNLKYYLSILNRPLNSIKVTKSPLSERNEITGLHLDLYYNGVTNDLDGILNKDVNIAGERYNINGIIDELNYLSIQNQKTFYNFNQRLETAIQIERKTIQYKQKEIGFKNESKAILDNSLSKYQITKQSLDVSEFPVSITANSEATNIEALDEVFYLNKIIKGFTPHNTFYLNKKDKVVSLIEVVSIQFEFSKERDFNEALEAWDNDKAGKYDYLSVPSEVFDYEGFTLDSEGIPYHILPGQDLGKPSIKVLYPKNQFYPETKDIGIKQVQVTIEAFYDVILMIHKVYKKDFYKLGGMYSDEALVYVLDLLKEYLESENKWNDEYKRIFRFCRWYAESTLVAYSTFILRRNYISYEVRNYIDIPNQLPEEIIIPPFQEEEKLEVVSKDYDFTYELVYPKVNALKYLDIHLIVFKDGKFVEKVSYKNEKKDSKYSTNYYYEIDENNYAYLERVEEVDKETQRIFIKNMYRYSFFLCLSNNNGYQIPENKTISLKLYRNSIEIKDFNLSNDNLINDDFEQTENIQVLSNIFVKNIEFNINDINQITNLNNNEFFTEKYLINDEVIRIEKDKFFYLNSFTTMGNFQDILKLVYNSNEVIEPPIDEQIQDNNEDEETPVINKKEFIFIKENFIDGYFSFSFIIANQEGKSGVVNLYIDKKKISSISAVGVIKEQIFFVERGIHLYHIEYIGDASVQIYNIGITGVVYEGATTECVDNNSFLGIRKVEMLLDKIFKYYKDHHLNKIKGSESFMQRKLWT